MTSARMILEAAAFAAERHAGQVRKGADAAPYVNHVLDVARRLAAAAPEDTTLLVAALLHDTVEDTETTSDDIARRFGPEIAGLVAEVTDDKSLPKAERKRLQVEHMPTASRRAQLIKLADKASNLTDILTRPPDWPAERRRAYLDWSRAVIAGCRGANAALEAEFDAIAATLERTLPKPSERPAHDPR